MRRIVLWSTDPVGERMAGPGIRYHRLATELARSHQVTLIAPGDGAPNAPYEFRTSTSVRSPAEHEPEVVVAQTLPLGLVRELHRRGVRLIFDLYAPALVEAAAQLAEQADGEPGIRFGEVLTTTRVILLFGDAFVCASERQRDHWLGALAGLGRVTPEVYADDPALDGLVAVVPFGLDVVADPASAAVVKGVLPGIAASDRLLLWGGGIWNWFDPLTVIRAAGALDERRGDVRLLFLGLAHPSSAVAAMSMAERAQALAVELGLEGRSVFFNRGWVPYAERSAWFAEADVGVSAHLDSLESRLAYRTRLLDHIAAGTPLVVTRGDVLADLVEARGLGRTVEPGDVQGWVTALAELLENGSAHAAASAATLAVRDELTWQHAGAALAALIERVAAAPRRPASAHTALAQAALAQARSSFERRGVRATVSAAARAVYGGRRR